MFRKTLAALLASLLALTALAGCNRGDGDSTTPATTSGITPTSTSGTTPTTTSGTSGDTSPVTQAERYFVPVKISDTSGDEMDVIFVWGENSLEIQNDVDTDGTRHILFDSQGNLSEEWTEDYHFKYEDEYDEHGNLINAIMKMKSGEEWIEIGRTQYEYDSNGKKTRAEHEFEMGEGGHYYVFYEYNGKGKLIKETESDWADMRTCRSYTEYEYDDNGNMVKQTDYDSDGNNRFCMEFEHDGSGNVVKVTQQDPYGDAVSLGFTYDSNGNRVKITQYDPDGAEHYATIEWIEGTQAQYRIYMESAYSLRFDPNEPLQG